MGINELLDMVRCIAKLLNGVGKSVDDGVFDLSDLLNFGPALSASFSAFSGVTEIPAELSDLSESEAAQVVKVFAEELELNQKDAERIAETSFPIVLQLAKFLAVWAKAA